MNWKDKILPETLELFLKYGIKSISMDDVSRALGISKKSLYEYIDTKDNLIDTVVKYHIEKEQEATEKILTESSNAVEEMIHTTRHVLKFMRKMSPSLLFDLKKYYPDIWQNIEVAHFNYIRSGIYTNLVRGQKEGLYRTAFNPDIISQLYISMAINMTNTDIFPLDKHDRASLFKELIHYHLHGIMTEKGLTILNKTDLSSL